MSRIPIEKVYPNGRCYCGCGESLAERTAFWVRGHDAVATHRVIRDQYGTVADFVAIHDDEVRLDLIEKLRCIEDLVFPQGREIGPPSSRPLTAEQWRQLRDLTHEVSEVPHAGHPGARSLLRFASGLLDERL